MAKAIRIIDPYAPLPTYKRIIAKYGGDFSFIQNFRMGGVGSPKMVYVSGIEEFDDIKNINTTDKPLLNIALLQKGIILRLNKSQRLGVAITLFSNIKYIRLNSFKIHHIHRNKIILVGTLELKIADQIIRVIVPAKEIKSVDDFFSKKYFSSVYESILDSAGPIRSDDPMLAFPEYYIT